MLNSRHDFLSNYFKDEYEGNYKRRRQPKQIRISDDCRLDEKTSHIITPISIICYPNVKTFVALKGSE
ncbi:hypothetical protein COCON_G00054120 [Conger conger]|uniref:Uncharacterized protein n=1 Tax=Conger conger TaxID=82655 RepID=A0A9Q1DWA4_CONCO|nr:hypothetical protein COCON_G00054120 [Conger conger]